MSQRRFAPLLPVASVHLYAYHSLARSLSGVYVTHSCTLFTKQLYERVNKVRNDSSVRSALEVHLEPHSFVEVRAEDTTLVPEGCRHGALRGRNIRELLLGD